MYYFQPDDFDLNYAKILRGDEYNKIYIDPDCCAGITKTNYYNLLTKFLLLRENELRKCELFEFMPPNKVKMKMDLENKKLEEYRDDYRLGI